MRPPAPGAKATLTVVVGEGMLARFDDEVVHPVYGTAALVRHVEQVSRDLLVPYLAPGEEGVGAELSLRQHAPVPLGGRVELTATVTAATASRMRTAVQARHGGRLVASATFTQVVVERTAFRTRAGLPAEAT